MDVETKGVKKTRRWMMSSSFRRLLAAAVCMSLTACHLASTGDSAIEFTVVPVAAVGGSSRVAPIARRVLGARSDQRIAVYAKSARGWWGQPVGAEPLTPL